MDGWMLVGVDAKPYARVIVRHKSCFPEQSGHRPAPNHNESIPRNSKRLSSTSTAVLLSAAIASGTPANGDIPHGCPAPME